MQLPSEMQAMVLDRPGEQLKLRTVAVPVVNEKEVLVKVTACCVCRTDLHVIDGELKDPKLPVIPGHEIIGMVVAAGCKVSLLQPGDLVGLPWLGYTCGTCSYCRKGKENLCVNALFTGYTKDGGFAEYTVADERYCFRLPDVFNDASKAPLLCAGLIGYRSYSFIGENVAKLGMYGFGAAAHILTQIATQSGKKVYAFTKDGDKEAQAFAIRMGATWAGNASEQSPEVLDAAIIFAPDGNLIPQALKNVDKGGVVVCGGIHMTDIPSFPYNILWNERTISSVANLTRKDGLDFVRLSESMTISTEVQFYQLNDTNTAIEDLRSGRLTGAAVILMQK